MKSPRITLLTILGILIGVLCGIGRYSFVYAKSYSYLLDNPSACANCHAMRTQHDAWMKSSHRSAATCNGLSYPTQSHREICGQGRLTRLPAPAPE
jgi:cytochrome c nitrite reductase small subunit